MASRYWQSIEHNPVEKFVPLPLDFMQKRLEEKQQKKDLTESQIYSMRDDDISTPYIRKTADEQRVLQGQQQYKQKRDELLNKFLEAKTEGDISGLSRDIINVNRWKQDMLKPTGEFGIIKQNYETYQKQLEQLDKSELPSDMKELAKQKLYNDFKTSGGTSYNPQTGSYNLMNQYTLPQNIKMTEFMQKVGRDIEDQKRDIQRVKIVNGEQIWTLRDGTEIRPEEKIRSIVEHAMKSDPEVQAYMRFGQNVGYDVNNIIKNKALEAAKIYGKYDITHNEDMKETGKGYQSGVNAANKIIEEEQTYRVPLEGQTYKELDPNDLLKGDIVIGDKTIPGTPRYGEVTGTQIQKETVPINYKGIKGSQLNQMLSGNYFKTDPTGNKIFMQFDKNPKLKEIALNMSNKNPNLTAEDIIKFSVNNYNQIQKAHSKKDDVVFFPTKGKEEDMRARLVSNYDPEQKVWRDGLLMNNGVVREGDKKIPLNDYIVKQMGYTFGGTGSDAEEALNAFRKTAVVGKLAVNNSVAPGAYYISYKDADGKNQKVIVQNSTQEQNEYAKGLWKINQIAYDPTKNASGIEQVTVPIGNNEFATYNVMAVKKYNWKNPSGDKVSESDVGARLDENNPFEIEYVKVDKAGKNIVKNAKGEPETLSKDFVDYSVNSADPFRNTQYLKDGYKNAGIPVKGESQWNIPTK
jgi:hypothetical protein